MDHKIYDSSRQTGYLVLEAPYYNAINPTEVEFPEEGIRVAVNSLGHLQVTGPDGKVLGAVDVPAHGDPAAYAHSAQYGTIRCIVEGNEVVFGFPVYTWEDCYPHCDGESDRWDRRTLRWFQVIFDCTMRQLQVVGR